MRAPPAGALSPLGTDLQQTAAAPVRVVRTRVPVAPAAPVQSAHLQKLLAAHLECRCSSGESPPRPFRPSAQLPTFVGFAVSIRSQDSASPAPATAESRPAASA